MTAVMRAPIVKKPQSKVAVNKDSIFAMTPESDKKVYGTFINIECPGQTGYVCVKGAYKGAQDFSQVFNDGEHYTIPLSVARHINENIYYEPHSYITDEKGQPLKTSKKIFRYKFMIESQL